MRNRISALIAAVLLPVALAACTNPRRAEGSADTSTAGATKVDTRNEEHAIREFDKRWEQLFNAKDASGMASLFADDGYEMTPNMKAMKGPEGVRKGYGEFFSTTKDLKLSFEASEIRIADAGDLAVERGTYHMSFTGPKGKQVEDRGNYVTVWKKVNGQWKVVADINASEVPMPM